MYTTHSALHYKPPYVVTPKNYSLNQDNSKREKTTSLSCLSSLLVKKKLELCHFDDNIMQKWTSALFENYSVYEFMIFVQN